jgi:hypothetical protein
MTLHQTIVAAKPAKYGFLVSVSPRGRSFVIAHLLRMSVGPAVIVQQCVVLGSDDRATSEGYRSIISICASV